MPSPVRVLTTGGTIDKVYSLQGMLEMDEPAVADLLAIGRSTVPVEIEAVLTKDSLDFDDADRGAIVDAVQRSPETRVLITHGTDTMTVTARALIAAGVGDRTVVLTGAMRPASMRDSDAPFNLGVALAAVQHFPSGVYIAMNGQVFAGDAVVKDRAAGRFLSHP